MRPRSPAVSPARSSASDAVAPCRPADTNTISVANRLPLFSVTTTLRSWLVSIAATSSPSLSVTPIVFA